MPIVRKIIFNGSRLDINVSEDDLINANNPSDISGEQFTAKDKAPTANALRILKQYIDSVRIPTGALTFDTTPTLGSVNPVTSDGIKRYIDNLILTFFSEHFITLTQEEYDEIENPRNDVYYFITENTEENGSS